MVRRCRNTMNFSFESKRMTTTVTVKSDENDKFISHNTE